MNSLEVTNEDLLHFAELLPLLEKLEVGFIIECRCPIDGLKGMLRDANKIAQFNSNTWNWRIGITTTDYNQLIFLNFR